MGIPLEYLVAGLYGNSRRDSNAHRAQAGLASAPVPAYTQAPATHATLHRQHKDSP